MQMLLNWEPYLGVAQIILGLLGWGIVLRQHKVVHCRTFDSFDNAHVFRLAQTLVVCVIGHISISLLFHQLSLSDTWVVNIWHAFPWLCVLLPYNHGYLMLLGRFRRYCISNCLVLHRMLKLFYRSTICISLSPLFGVHPLDTILADFWVSYSRVFTDLMLAATGSFSASLASDRTFACFLLLWVQHIWTIFRLIACF